MSKRSASTLETYPVHSFYRPHNRADTWFTNEVADPVTGELTQLPSMTKQSHVAECDINNILKQFKRTGMLNHVTANQPKYMDLPDELDFQQSLHQVAAATDAFASLPSKLRSRFNNDPAEFLAFMSDPKNLEEIVELGLATKRATDAPIEPQAPSAPPEPAKAPEGSKTAPEAK